MIEGNVVLQYKFRFRGKESACNAGDRASVPGLAWSPEEGNGNPLKYYCRENPKDRGAGWAIVHGAPNSQTQLSDWGIS